ncbi:MAG: CPBP family intramembrane metalloprotease [Parcubacteria group bacterium]|nr:CPBP family intramembrane metalloprotease [Parcubacteria group bacterium]
MQTPVRDENIRKLIKSWNPAVKLLLIIIALFTVAPIMNFTWRIILYIYTFINDRESYYLITDILDNLFSYNARFGGFTLFCFFFIWKGGKIADIVLASPVGYKKIKIDNVYLRLIVYFSAIIILGFGFHGLRYLFGLSQIIFSFKTSFWDFAVITFFAPISEEIYYRFLIIYITGSIFGRATGIALSLSLFVLSHDYSQLGIIEIIWVASLALANTAATISFGSLWPAIAIHSINNTLVYFLRPF